MPEETNVRCPFCDAVIPADEHWRGCPAAPDYLTSDDDPDADKTF